MIRKVAYWITTGLVALAYLYGAYTDITQPSELVEGATKLGYPLFFFTILGIWKVGGAIVILSPGLPRVKEWAYAGIVINLTAAAATHVYLNDPAKNVATPLVLLGIVMASWALRPASRRLAGPWL